MKKSLLRRLMAVTVSALVFVSGGAGAFACTGVYFGSETTDSGSTYWGRSEDISSRYSKLFTVHPAELHEAGSYYVSSTGFKWPYPAETLRYTLAKDSYFNEGISPEPYAEVGMNEKNVSISATVTISGAKTGITSAGNDPMVSTRNGGLAETDLASLVLMQAQSARGAIELVAQVIDAVGAAGREAFTVSDPRELWYMEILSGHQYVAVKAPKDKIAASPNLTMLDAVDITDVENVIASPNLVQVVEKAGTLAKDDQGRIRIADSYASLSANLNTRLYLAYYYLKGVAAAKALTGGTNPYYIDPRPEKGYSLYEALRFLAYHGNQADAADGKYNANPTSNGAAIGNGGTVESHIFENRQNMPDDLSTVEWLAMGPAEFSIYLPYYGSLITETYDSYWNADSASFNADSFYWVCRQLFTTCNANRGAVEGPVAAFLERYQKSLIDQQASVDEAMLRIYAQDPALAQEKATALSKAVAGETFKNLQSLLAAVQAYLASDRAVPFQLPESLAVASPDYSISAVGGTGISGSFEVEADKGAKTVSVSGQGYQPHESLSLRVAYNSVPTKGANDFQTVVTADDKGVVKAKVPVDATEDAPWLGGQLYFASLGGESASAAIYATTAKAHSAVRANAKLKKPFKLAFAIDGTKYEFISSNPSVATVDAQGNVNPVRVGTAIISIRATDGGAAIGAVMLNVTT